VNPVDALRTEKLQGYTGAVAPLLLLMMLANDPVAAIARCAVIDDPQGRVYELLQSGEGASTRWRLGMRSREAGERQVVMPLPDAKPVLNGKEIVVDYRSLNGGREVRWKVAASGASLSVYANFELEVNVEADLDPRVDLMNTDGPISRLSCSLPR